MKLSCAFLAVLLFLCAVPAQNNNDRLVSPWEDTTRALVLDGYHENDIDWKAITGDKRVAGMIFRASGPVKNETGRYELLPDPGYQSKKSAAKNLGYLWGSFHVGMRNVDAVEQAKFYLETAKPADDEVIALDLENTRDPRYMTLKQAVRFIEYIKKETGRYPLLYVTGGIHDEIFAKYGKLRDNVFAKTPLWYVRVKRDITPFLKKSVWPTYTLWQFSSELNCCRKVGKKRVCVPPAATCPFEQGTGTARVPRVPGVAYDMDINVYYGTRDELTKAWPFTFRHEAVKNP